MDQKEIERWYRLRNLKRASQFLVIVAVVLLLSGYGLSRYFSQRPPEFQMPQNAQHGICIEHFAFSCPGAHPWELEASKARVSDSLDRVTLKDLKVTYRGGEGAAITLSAKSGKLDRNNRNVSAKGDVTVRYEDFLFKTSDIRYSQEDGLAETSSPVTFRGGSMMLDGIGLKVLVRKEEIRVERDVRAVLFNVKWVEPGRKLPM